MPSISPRVENVEPLRRYPDFVVVYLLGVYFGRQRECGGAYPLFSEADGVYGVGFLRSFLGDVRYSLSFSTGGCVHSLLLLCRFVTRTHASSRLTLWCSDW